MILKILFTNFDKDIISKIYPFIVEDMTKYKKIHKEKSKTYLFLIDFNKSMSYYENNTIKLPIILDMMLISRLII